MNLELSSINSQIKIPILFTLLSITAVTILIPNLIELVQEGKFKPVSLMNIDENQVKF